MSTKQYSKAQLNWYRCGYKCITATISNGLKKSEDRNGRKVKLGYDQQLQVQWRFGYNLYMSSQYYESIEILETVCAGGPIGIEKRSRGEESVHKNSNVHLCAARCCVQLFLLTKSHYHLENAYRHYQNSIERLPVDLVTMFKLPTILLEFGRMLEYYGAFESALDLYSRILTNFPNYRGYFDAMYRSAVVGNHMAEMSSNVQNKEDLLNKCIDILQFLLEALPNTIDDMHVILLYARTLEASANPATRFRAPGAYQGLYEYCKNGQDRPINNSENHADFKSWLDDPVTWLSVGEAIEESGEPIISKHGYENYVQKLQKKKGRDYASSMDVSTALKIAKTYATFQNYNAAVKYGEIALNKDRLHKDTRINLSKWSKIYDKTLRKEEKAVNALTIGWKSRCWSNGYQRKLKNKIVQEMEAKLNINRFDSQARGQLEYYARDKWRSKFLFEEECVRRVQRFFRMKRKMWTWQQARRQQHLNRTVEVYQLYIRKPWDHGVRALVKEVTSHRFCPRKHIINRVRLVIDEQDNAAATIRRVYMLHRSKQAIKRCIRDRRLKYFEMNAKAAIVIQCLLRRKLSYNIKKRMLKRRKELTIAARCVQTFIRWRRSTFQHSVTRVMVRRQDAKSAAKKTLRKVFLHYYRAYIKYKKEDKLRIETERSRQADMLRLVAYQTTYNNAVAIVKRFIKRIYDRSMASVALQLLKARNSVGLSIASSHMLSALGSTIDSGVRYRNPGIKQNTTQFSAALQQVVTYCDSTFTHFDSMLLSNVIRNKFSSVQRLVMHDIADGKNPSYEFDLLVAIGQGKSLRSVSVLGGSYTSSFLINLLNEVQMENAAIKELCVENMHKYGESIAAAGGRLLCDYFNYSLPGLMTLSLHGCYIQDMHLDLMEAGLQVNTSIRTLILSRNLLTDCGFNRLFAAIVSNKRGKLQCLDCSWNLLTCKRNMRKLLDEYTCPFPTESFQLNLSYNMILLPYAARVSTRGRYEITVACTGFISSQSVSASCKSRKCEQASTAVGISSTSTRSPSKRGNTQLASTGLPFSPMRTSLSADARNHSAKRVPVK